MHTFPRWLTVAFIILAAAAAIVFLGKTGKVTPIAERTASLRLQSFALSLHPLKMADVESRQVASLLHIGLIAQEQDGTTRPAIASAWSHKGNEWAFTLQKNITFANGSPVTAKDIAASLCASMQPSSPWSWALASIDQKTGQDGKTRECTGIITTGEDQIKIVESRPVPWLLDALSGPAGWILPMGVKEEAYGVVSGAGPFRVKEIVPDVRVILEARSTGSAISPGVKTVTFEYVPDDSVAAQKYSAGQLDVLDLTSPQLQQLLVDATGKLKYPGTITQHPWDRVRLVIVNEKSLSSKGFSSQQVRDFIDSMASTVDRTKIASLAKGAAGPLAAPFPPAKDIPEANTPRKIEQLNTPKTNLTILTESDPYSDLIAASLPKQVGSVTMNYKGVDKGMLLNSLFKGEFDLISMLIEATVHSPEFWKAFFTPGNPYSVAGKPLSGLDKVDVSTNSGVADAGKRILHEGNWIALLQEKRIQAVAPGISGISFSPSGQTNFAFIKKD